MSAAGDTKSKGSDHASDKEKLELAYDAATHVFGEPARELSSGTYTVPLRLRGKETQEQYYGGYFADLGDSQVRCLAPDAAGNPCWQKLGKQMSNLVTHLSRAHPSVLAKEDRIARNLPPPPPLRAPQTGGAAKPGGSSFFAPKVLRTADFIGPLVAHSTLPASIAESAAFRDYNAAIAEAARMTVVHTSADTAARRAKKTAAEDLAAVQEEIIDGLRNDGQAALVVDYGSTEGTLMSLLGGVLVFIDADLRGMHDVYIGLTPTKGKKTLQAVCDDVDKMLERVEVGMQHISSTTRDGGTNMKDVAPMFDDDAAFECALHRLSNAAKRVLQVKVEKDYVGSRLYSFCEVNEAVHGCAVWLRSSGTRREKFAQLQVSAPAARP